MSVETIWPAEVGPEPREGLPERFRRDQIDQRTQRLSDPSSLAIKFPSRPGGQIPYHKHRHLRECPGAFMFSWREISQYVGVSADTVRRLHRVFGFPVVRFAMKRVFTTPGAIDAWIEKLSREERLMEQEFKTLGNGKS